MNGTVIEDPFQEPCKAGQKAATCRYIVFDTDGFRCAKHNHELAKQINYRVERGLMTAIGDNCEGKRP